MIHPDGLTLRPAGGLIDRAIEALRAGPLPTQAIARLVLGIQGSPPAAATAVFTLLGTDPRFSVDAQGVWRLVAAAAEPDGIPLHQEDWVVVDVETTGGSPRHGHRITEIAAVRVSRGRVAESWSTLVNPQRRIPGMITALTGITDEMVRDAPVFAQILPELGEMLAGRIFVAHNAAFDWGFLDSEVLRAAGQRLEGRQLCTVRLARRLLPQLPSRSLGALAHYYGLEIESRHRALDDAVATAHVLVRLLDQLDGMEVCDWAQMQRFMARPYRQPRRRAMPRSMDEA